jgi:hypothetical protein
MAELGSQRLLEALRAVEDLGRSAPGVRAALREPGEEAGWAAPTDAEPGAAVRDVLVGALASVPAVLAAALASMAPARAKLGRIAGRGQRVLGRVPGARAVTRRWHAARVDAARGLARLAAVGHAEGAEGRRLAQAFLSGASAAAVARVAESPELKRVIGEQSQGLAATAVDELRERSARADTAAESVLRRLTGRSRSGGSK